MINLCFFCKSNHWPARLKKVDTITRKVIKFQNELNFKLNVNYYCNIVLTDNNFIKKMNFKFRKKNHITDVLTFVSEINVKKKKKEKICDIFLSAETIKKDAEKNNIYFYNHLSHLLIHSFLHVNGFNHKKIKDFDKMKKIEIYVLNKLGINDPYLYS